MSYVAPDQPYEPKRWEGLSVANGVFPLRRFLGGSDQGAVFLSEYDAGRLADVALKLVPTTPSRAEVQLARWRAVAALSHPHLVRLFEMGRCQLDGREYLFVVMEYGEQTLAQVLAQRALSPEEVRELLIPTLDALAFLHRQQLVHTRVKPSNLLAVGDQLKLTSDRVSPPGTAASSSVANFAYEAPELEERGVSTASDIWSLGVTLVEALTQSTSVWSDELGGTIALPANVPASLARPVQRCLSLSPVLRPNVIDLQALFRPAAPPQLAVDEEPAAREVRRDAATARPVRRRNRLLLPVAGALLASLAAWVGLRSSETPSQASLQSTPVPVPALDPEPAPAAAPVQVPTPAPVAAATAPLPDPTPVESSPPPAAEPPTPTSPYVLIAVTPEVPPALRNKIQGRVLVTVRVLVDPAGDVIAVLMENTGSNRYCADLADAAARKWKFVPTGDGGNRVWQLRFAFTRDGVTSRAVAV